MSDHDGLEPVITIGWNAHRAQCDRSPQYPRRALLPLGDPILLTHPTLDLLQEPGLACMAKAFGDIEASAEATALTHPEWPLCYSTARSAVGVTSARSPGCVMPGCAIKLQSKM